MEHCNVYESCTRNSTTCRCDCAWCIELVKNHTITTLRAKLFEARVERDHVRPVIESAIRLWKKLKSDDIADDDHGEQLGDLSDTVSDYLQTSTAKKDIAKLLQDEMGNSLSKKG